MHEPAFWRANGPLSALLAPVGALYAGVTALRMTRPGWVAPVPVICCGAATAGGAGKTPLALDLSARLIARGRRPAFLTRGHGGHRGDGLPVDPARDDAASVGDEALLLAAVAPTYVAVDRAVGAKAAVAAGADVLVMDDGLQNPTLAKSFSLLVIEGGEGFGNGRVIPAGPLREPVRAAAARCRAAVLIGSDRAGALARLPPGLPVLSARLAPLPEPGMVGARVVAFCGIGRPAKFWTSLAEAGCEVVARRAFPDHHRYQVDDVRALRRLAGEQHARLVTTAKDAARLPAPWRADIGVLRVALDWVAPEAIEALLDLT